MSFDATVLEVFIASPGDVFTERDEIETGIYEWNNTYAKDLKIVLIPRRWEKDVTPTYHGSNPQEVINQQVVHVTDFVIGVFWSRLGTKTEKFPSGTLEELDHFMSTGKEVMIYFVEKHFPPNMDFTDVARVQEYKKKYSGLGLYATYKGKEEIIRHLYKKVMDYKQQASIPESSSIPPLYTKEVTAEIAQKVEGVEADNSERNKSISDLKKSNSMINNQEDKFAEVDSGNMEVLIDDVSSVISIHTIYGDYSICFVWNALADLIHAADSSEGRTLKYHFHNSDNGWINSEIKHPEFFHSVTSRPLHEGDILVWQYSDKEVMRISVSKIYINKSQIYNDGKTPRVIFNWAVCFKEAK